MIEAEVREFLEAGKSPCLQPKYLRAGDVRRVFGIPRGSLYGLLGMGKIKGRLLKISGAKSGIRVFDVDSIVAFIESQPATGLEGGAA